MRRPKSRPAGAGSGPNHRAPKPGQLLMPDIVCLYFGPADECVSCGWFKPPTLPFCSHDCAEAYAARGAAIEAAVQARRDREDEFARRCEGLRRLGFVDVQIDILLAGFPT